MAGKQLETATKDVRALWRENDWKLRRKMYARYGGKTTGNCDERCTRFMAGKRLETATEQQTLLAVTSTARIAVHYNVFS